MFFGDADPPVPGNPYNDITIAAGWGAGWNKRLDHFILIDTTKLPEGTTWASREMNQAGRPEWILATSKPVDVSSAVVGHGHVNLLNK